MIRVDQHRLYGGNYSYYIEQIEQEKVAEADSRAEARPVKAGHKAGKCTAAGKSPATSSPYAKMKLSELEEFIAAHEAKIARLRERFGDPNVYKDPAKIGKLRTMFDRLSAELGEAEEVWLDHASE